jgi:ABC-type branched-subunit amino acid transport system substrate-binding protein
MMGYIESARMRLASGRFVMTALVMGACQMAGPTPSAPPPDLGPPDPVVETGTISAGAEAQAAALFNRAQEAYRAGRFSEAREVTAEIVSQHPTAPVSGRALLLNARAAGDDGDASAADAAAEQYLGLLSPDDARIASVRLLQAEAFTDDPAARVDRLMRITGSAPSEDVALARELARGAADLLTPDQLQTARVNTASDAPLLWILDVRAATAALEAGDDGAASELAQRALDSGAVGRDVTVAQNVLRGELPAGRFRSAALNIATVLPVDGPPALADFAALVAEGIEVAASQVLGDGFDVTIIARDDQADPTLTASLVTELESQPIAGAIGFLEDVALEAGGQARRRGLPLISPTARNASRGGDGVYSLEGPDPEAAAAVAQYAADQGYLRVSIVHSQVPESVAEADAFERAIEGLGIPVVGRYAYEAGATFFEDQIIAARNALRQAEIAALELGEDDTLHVELLEPVAVFLPIPSEDVVFVAPQVTHFGLDTLAIDMLGTSAWTDPGVLEEVDTRHTTGVVATAAVGRELGSPGRLAFQAAYENHFQRSLVSPVPAVGYDAALLLLEALRGRPRNSTQVQNAFETLRDVEGATGIFSVVGGQVVRRTELVYIDDGILVPIG